MGRSKQERRCLCSNRFFSFFFSRSLESRDKHENFYVKFFFIKMSFILLHKSTHVESIQTSRVMMMVAGSAREMIAASHRRVACVGDAAESR
jgi:hypothetical protein